MDAEAGQYTTLPAGLAWVLGGRQLNRMQREALRVVLHERRNLLLAAPTGSGKTLLAEIALAATAGAGGLGVYLAPMKAIAAERQADWERLTRAGIRIYKTTGDDDAFDPRQAEGSQVILATPEKWDGVARRGLPLSLAGRLRLVVIDEVHLIGESGRGAQLEALLTRQRLRLPATRLLAMSGTIANAAEIAAWLDADLYESHWRPVPLRLDVVPYEPPADRKQEEALRTRQTADLLAGTVHDGGAVLVFCGSRAGVERCAVQLAYRLQLPPAALDTARASLNQALAGGVAYHHAGLSPHERRGVEALFRDGKVQVLVATSTVAAGVNLPARQVIVRDLYLGTVPVAASTLLQMAGRAGRPGLEVEGLCSILAPQQDAARVQTLLAGQPVTSRLAADLETFLNAEVAAGDVRTWTEAHQWYKQTLLGATQPDLTRLKDAVAYLSRHNLLREHGGRYASTALGRTCSALMLRARTAALLAHVVAQWSDRPLPAGALEEQTLYAVCRSSAEWGDEMQRPDPSGLSEAVHRYDSGTLGWDPGRTRMFAVTACVLAGVPLDGYDVEDEWSVRHAAQADLPRVLRFVARCALEREPPAPHLGLAAADLAASLEFGVADRGAGALLEAIRRQFPPDDQRRRKVAARYAALRTRQDGTGAGLSPAEERFLARRPLLRLTGRPGPLGYEAVVEPLGEDVEVYLRCTLARGIWSGRLRMPRGGILPLFRPADGAFVECVAVAAHPILWHYARFDGPSAPAPDPGGVRRVADGVPDAWRVLDRFRTPAPRRLPLAEYLQRPRQPAGLVPECPLCGAPMRAREGIHGAFWGCSRYPSCRGTVPRD